ncbi:hypothetical protein LG201_05600 [Methylobacillus gramineus]|uniref:hypothetical protein n=1 Tax=Methylobacillus gramineus TaxID=755169 RepID=UPI001CFFFDFA|nr:hypothetical protein [Methylobacillus gramineus]MCB5184673.1 hypothetical protein [Methylobacillus gramineus]
MSKPKAKASADDKPDSLSATLLAIGRLGLMVIGIIGIAVDLFRDDGWLKQAFSKLFSSTTGMIAIPVIILLVYLANRWFTAPRRGELTKRGDIPLYLMMGIGAFFLFRLITTGSF